MENIRVASLESPSSTRNDPKSTLHLNEKAHTPNIAEQQFEHDQTHPRLNHAFAFLAMIST